MRTGKGLLATKLCSSPECVFGIGGFLCCTSGLLGCIGRRRLRGSLPDALRLVVLFSPCWGFSVFVLPLVVVALPRGPRGLVGALAPCSLAGSLAAPGGLRCCPCRFRVLRSWCFVFEKHDFVCFCLFPRGCVFWPFFAAFSELRGARQVERFAACSFRHLLPVVFPSWRVASEFF